MRDPKRIKKILKTIENIWKKNPDLRLCQLLENTAIGFDRLYYFEDDELIKKLKEMYG